MDDKEKQAWDAFKEGLLVSVEEMLEYYEKRRAYEIKKEQEPAPPEPLTYELKVWDKDRFTKQECEANIKQILDDILKIRNQF